MSLRHLAPVTLQREPRSAQAPGLFERMYLAIDPDSGHLYPTDAPAGILFREDATSGHLFPSDDATLATARFNKAANANLRVY